MKKYIIAYYSRTGTSKLAAEKLYEFLGEKNADIEEIIDEKRRKGIIGYISSCKDALSNNITKIAAVSNPPCNYEETILVTPIWAGKVSDAARTYLATYKSDIKSLVLITTAMSSTGAGAQKDIFFRFALRTKKLISLTKGNIKDGNIEQYFSDISGGEEDEKEK